MPINTSDQLRNVKSEIGQSKSEVNAGNINQRVLFGSFDFYPARGVLYKQDRPIRIGSRALALLTTLAENTGNFVTAEQLIKSAWPNTVVEETNLRVQITALRKLLDEPNSEVSCIINAPGRGYALAIKDIQYTSDSKNLFHKLNYPIGLPPILTPLLGREEIVDAVTQKLTIHRFLTIVGPGGIGKTRVASEVCWEVSNTSELMVYFVDLAPLQSSDMVLSTIASVLKINDSRDKSLHEQVIEFLGKHKTLLVLDNCEHVLDSAVELTELFLSEVKELRILATSREPLLVNGETAIRLTGLALPTDGINVPDIDTALQYSAIDLLVQRATAHGNSIVFSDQDVCLMISICRRLDGIPLAIELAAARVEALGLETLTKLLDDKLSILGGGPRYALPRHQTLVATMAWSYDSLLSNEQLLLLTVSVFRSPFSIEAARFVSQIPIDQLVDGLSNLVSKSLIVVEHANAEVKYRLLETTRKFSEQKLLTGTGDLDASVRHRHAEYCIDVFSNLKAEGKLNDTQFDFRQLGAEVRAAVTWCMDSRGDAKLGIRLIVDSGTMWLRLSLLPQYVKVIELAASRLVEDKSLMTKEGRWLAPMLHMAYFNSAGLSADKIVPMLLNSLRLAQEADDYGCMLNCLWPLFGTCLTEGKYLEAYYYSRQFLDLAPKVNDQVQMAMGERLVGLTLWRKGELYAAIDISKEAVKAPVENKTSPLSGAFIYKQVVASRANASNLFWLAGKADEAEELANQAVSIGLKKDLVGLSYALAQTIIPLWFWLGNYHKAEEQTALLMDLTKQIDLGYWYHWGKCHECCLKYVGNTKVPENEYIFTSGKPIDALHRHILGTMIGGLPMSWVMGLDPPYHNSKPHWCSAEQHRLIGNEYLNSGNQIQARFFYEKAIAIASVQGALAWQLRAATSMAELDLHEGKTKQAKSTLEPVLLKVKQGANSGDVLFANQVLSRITSTAIDDVR